MKTITNKINEAIVKNPRTTKYKGYNNIKVYLYDDPVMREYYALIEDYNILNILLNKLCLRYGTKQAFVEKFKKCGNKIYIRPEHTTLPYSGYWGYGEYIDGPDEFKYIGDISVEDINSTFWTSLHDKKINKI